MYPKKIYLCTSLLTYKNLFIMADMTEKTVEPVVNRYSDEDLAEFKALIEKKIEDAKKAMEVYQEAYSGVGNDTSDTAPTFKNMEEGNQVLSKEENSRLAGRLDKYIANLEAALVRIENKTYGIDRITGKLISKERLRIVPHATLDVDSKLNEKRK